MQKNKVISTKTLTVLAMICAIAFILAAYVRIPITPPATTLTLRYDPKDIAITIGGFMFGPLAAAAVSVVVALIQMVTVSATGFWGAVMNIITSCAFCCTGAFIYGKDRGVRGAILGLAAAIVVATVAAMLANLLIVPIFMGRPREQVWPLLVPLFLPFNLINNTLNAAFTLALYKHVKMALQKARLMPPEKVEKTGRMSVAIAIISLLVIAYMVLWVFVWHGSV